jgi:predicted YcjX-like family ATPase
MPKRKLRVGFVGVSQSGKTTFLTSLINHLRRHSQDAFPLRNRKGKPINLRHKEEPPTGLTLTGFDYSAHRANMQKRRWPVKTTDLSEYHCLLERTDWWMDRIDLLLTDFAGERLADVTMAGRDYAQWSDSILEFYQREPYKRLLTPYLDLVTSAGELKETDEERVTDAYRLALARFMFEFLLMVTPSHFALDVHGVMPESDKYPTPESLAAGRYAGKSPAEQFAPLPKEVRDRSPELAALFAERYKSYRDSVVTKLAYLFADCDALVVLLDIPWMLAAGSGARDAVAEMLAVLLQFVDPGQHWSDVLVDKALRTVTLGAYGVNDAARGLVKLFGINSRKAIISNVRRIAFVGTKTDKVHQDDRNDLKSLLEDLTDPIIKTLRQDTNLVVDNFVCAAVRSTESLELPWMLGRLEPGPGQPPPPGGEVPTVRYQVSDVPVEWPATGWPAGQYRFPDILPVPPEDRQTPPDHIHLNQVFNFLMDIW